MGSRNTEGAPRAEHDDLPVELARAFGRFGPGFVQWMKSGVRDEGVSLGRLRLLRALELGGAQIMTQLRRDLGVTARNVTQLVDGLEADGLVRRQPHPHDRRATVIELTERGRRRCGHAFDAHLQRTAKLFGRLGPEDQQHLLQIMERLIDHLAEMEERPCSAPDPCGPESELDGAHAGRPHEADSSGQV